jgi:Mg2+ and Co2+ transporter CorA
MIDKKHAYEVMEKSVEDLFALCQKFEEENAALSKDLERQVELNHAQLQEIERLRALVGRCEEALEEAQTYTFGSTWEEIEETLAAIREMKGEKE